MSELSLFLYPWDAQCDGVPATVERVRELGATRMSVAATYHSAEVITPRASGPLVTHVEANRAHLPLPDDAFSGVRLPQSAFAAEHPDCFPRLAEQAAAAGVGLTAWVIGLHNSSLAQAHPELAIESCAGDRSAHGLCPAAPACATYVRELVAAVAASGLFDRVLLESASYLLAGHGHPHELAAVRLDARSRLLLSLCFCEHCAARAERSGIDVAGLRRRCRERLVASWHSPLLARRAPDEGLELAALLVADAELAAYARMRCEVVSELVEAAARELAARGVELSVASAVWGRPAPANWTEGIDLGRTARAAGQVALTTYAADPASVARELDHALEQVPADRLMQLNTLWPEHHRSADELLAKVRLALDVGVRDIGLYNLAMAPPAVADWTRAVADLVGTA